MGVRRTRWFLLKKYLIILEIDKRSIFFLTCGSCINAAQEITKCSKNWHMWKCRWVFPKRNLTFFQNCPIWRNFSGMRFRRCYCSRNLKTFKSWCCFGKLNGFSRENTWFFSKSLYLATLLKNAFQTVLVYKKSEICSNFGYFWKLEKTMVFFSEKNLDCFRKSLTPADVLKNASPLLLLLKNSQNAQKSFFRKKKYDSKKSSQVFKKNKHC